MTLSKSELNAKLTSIFGEPISVTLDGKFHRFGKSKEHWLVGKSWDYNSKEHWALSYGSWNPKWGIETNRITSWGNQPLSQGEKISVTRKFNLINRIAKKERERDQEWSREFWLLNWDRLASLKEAHSYMKDKGFSHNFGAKVVNFIDEKNHLYPGTLCVPVFNHRRELCGVQRIFSSKHGWTKVNFPGTELKGPYHSFGDWETAKTLYLCEGFATGASIFDNIKLPVICSFSANNLPNVARTIREYNPSCTIILAADNDKDSQVGKIWAYKTLKETACIIKIVQFPPGAAGNDYNDLAQIDPELLKEQLSITQIPPDEEFKHLIKKGFTESVTNERGQDKIKRLGRELLRFFRHKYHYHYLLDRGEIIIWEDGHYKKVPGTFAKIFAEQYYDNPKCLNDNERIEFQKLCQVNYAIRDSHKFFDRSKIAGKINFSNGVYDLKNDKLLSHAPTTPFQYIFPHPYQKSRKCPTMDGFLEAFSCSCKKTTSVLWEYLGWIIPGDSPIDFKKALILDGSGENGKSTFINIVKTLVGARNTSAVSISAVPKNRFILYQMDGKLVNFAEEEPPSIFSNTGGFKGITGGSPMYIERKGKDGKSVVIMAKIIISYNDMPPLSDSSKGMQNRLLIIPCNQDYTKNPHLKISNIEEKIKKEAPSILYRAIEALKAAIQRGGFTEIPKGKERIQEMLRDGCSVYEWVSAHLEKDTDFDGQKKSFQELYGYYREAMNINGDDPVSKTKFGRKLKKVLANGLIKCEVGPFQFNIEGKWEKLNGVKGVRVKHYGR